MTRMGLLHVALQPLRFENSPLKNLSAFLRAGFLYLVKETTFKHPKKQRHHFSIFMKVKDTIKRLEKEGWLLVRQKATSNTNILIKMT